MTPEHPSRKEFIKLIGFGAIGGLVAYALGDGIGSFVKKYNSYDQTQWWNSFMARYRGSYEMAELESLFVFQDAVIGGKKLELYSEKGIVPIKFYDSRLLNPEQLLVVKTSLLRIRAPLGASIRYKDPKTSENELITSVLQRLIKRPDCENCSGAQVWVCTPVEKNHDSVRLVSILTKDEILALDKNTHKIY